MYETIYWGFSFFPFTLIWIGNPESGFEISKMLLVSKFLIMHLNISELTFPTYN